MSGKGTLTFNKNLINFVYFIDFTNIKVLKLTALLVTGYLNFKNCLSVRETWGNINLLATV